MNSTAPKRRRLRLIPRLVPLRRPAARLARALAWGALAAYFVLAALILGLRYGVLPNIERYRPTLERALSGSLGLEVRIGGIEAHWRGLHPRLALHRFQVIDREGRPALAFDNVEAELAWSSLWLWQPRLQRLEIVAPVLDMRRDTAGRVYVAGIQLNTEAEGTDFSDWLLAQHTIIVRDATVRWDDARRGAPPLEIRGVNFRLENRGMRHRFGLTGEPPRALASRLELRGDFRGEDPDRPQEWRGDAYALLEYADLAVWRQWVDYPVELPRGAGGMRMWLRFDGPRLTGATADIALRDVQLRLRPELPMLDLQALEGRLSGRQLADGFEAGARKLSLALSNGVRVEPTDFQLRWTRRQGAGPGTGELTANGLDLDALAHLAAYLPLEAGVRRTLDDYAPRGRLAQVTAGWKGDGETLVSYHLTGRFQQLAVRPRGELPGFDGMSGRLDATDKGGTVVLQSRSAALELPAVFAQARLPLEQFNGQVDWTVKNRVVEATLRDFNFHNRDATGIASGRYRSSPEGPGEIDLTARLTNSDGSAVWRYMPLVVNPGVRDWLRNAIHGGVASEATLRLKGNLRDFPYDDGKSGIFQVSGRFSGVTLNYASDWPQIKNINGGLLFEGRRMLITGDSGSVYGVGVSQVKAEIPDLREPMLTVTGKAAGPLPDYLRFINTSPLAQRVGEFVAGMSGSGNGRLDLKLVMPLHAVEQTRVAGEFEFLRDRVIVDPEVPALTDVAGKLQFTESTLGISGIGAGFLGGPLALRGETQKDGTIALALQGTLDAAAVRREYALPVLDYLSGAAAYRGGMFVRKSGTEVVVESSLQGMASTLPEPLKKAAGEALPLRFERKPAGAARLLTVTAGDRIKAVFVRRGDGTAIERGALGIGEPAQLPDRGLALAASVKSFDADFWRRLLPGQESGAGAARVALPAITQVYLRAGEATAYGRRLTDVTLRASEQGGTWQANLASREATGELQWQGRGKGRLRARLKQLVLADAERAKTAVASEAPKELPGLDVVAEAFTLSGKQLGRLELNADNEGSFWKIERLVISNPDGALNGSGQWRANATQLNFRLEVNDIGGMLGRLGYAEAVKHGTATLEGKLAWNGAPVSIDYPSLDGTLKLDAARGQFAKLDPGVGRLLSILSLQALPRRISLDFRDVFSEGFAFDGITGSGRIQRGVMSTNNLLISGPAAKVFMSGDINLAAETQNLRVRVQPAIGESVAVGAMIANPAIGIAALLAQKVLRDPLDQIFAYQYAVTGSWSDPKVEKLRSSAVSGAATNAGP